MIIETIKGNLLTEFKNGRFSAIGHGCNCFHLQKAGIAGQISKEFPEALEKDKGQTVKGDWVKLGGFSVCDTQFGSIFNLYTQYLPGPHFEYTALEVCLEALYNSWCYDEEDFVLGLPMIGAGIGGGDWNIIKEILEASSIKIIVVEYDNRNISLGQGEINFPS
jgi:O-acetyl-ADP-ribose deacetylase (regulator of RNase III)